MDKKNIVVLTALILVSVLVLFSATSFASIITDVWSVSTQSEWNSVFSTASENTTVQNSRVKIENKRWKIKNTKPNDYIITKSNLPWGLSWKPDGTKFYISGTYNNRIYYHEVSDPWNISSSVYTNSIKTVDAPNDVFWKLDGTKMYILGSKDNIYQYEVSDPWNISSAIYSSPSQSGKSKSISRNPYGLYIKSDGTKLYVVNNYEEVVEYDIEKPWDITSVNTTNKSKYSINVANSPRGITFKPDGKKMYISIPNTNKIYEYELLDSWDISSANYTNNRISTQIDKATDITWKPDGTKLYEVGESDSLYESTIPTSDSGMFVSNWHNYNSKKTIKNITQNITGSGNVEVKIEAYDSSTASTSETNWLTLNSNGTITKNIDGIEGDRVRVKYKLAK